MENALYIIPFLISILSFSLLFLNAKKTLAIVAAAIIFLMAIGFSATSTFMVSSLFRDMVELELEIKRLNNWKKHQVSNLHSLLAQFRKDAVDNHFKMEYMGSFGWHITNAVFVRSLEADKLRQMIIDKLPKDHYLSKPVKVMNLPDDIDKVIIAGSLEGLGFAVVDPSKTDDSKETVDGEKGEDGAEEENKDPKAEEQSLDLDGAENEATEPATDEIDLANLQRANVMYYGPYVKNYEIKLIALTMIRAGVQLKYLRLAQYSNNNDPRSVVFDWSNPYEARPTIEPMELYKQRSFRRK